MLLYVYLGKYVRKTVAAKKPTETNTREYLFKDNPFSKLKVLSVFKCFFKVFRVLRYFIINLS